MVTGYRINILEKKLQELTEEMPSIQGAVIVSIEGFIVAAYPTTDTITQTMARTDTPQVAAMAATLFALGEQTLNRLAQGQVERLMIEGERGAMIVYPINQNAALAAMVSKGAKMGLALLAVARASEFFAQVLSGAS
ncbi:MAG TPA: roadblock/LC7 domain-containing protein [Anaerolineae bacterium]|nr:roadblock/LC7 domain-containing protein [Anaerolineae bacterium]